MIKQNLKRKLVNKELVLGTFLKINSPSIVEILGYSNVEFIVVDCEHGSFSIPDVENMIRTGNNVGMEVIVRTADAGVDSLLHTLDSGATGVQVPGLRTADEVKEVIRCCKYFPKGSRGLSYAQRAAGYGLFDKQEYVRTSNDNGVTVIHIENIKMAKQVSQLCKIEGLDVLFIGPADLSQSLGLLGSDNREELDSLIKEIIQTAINNNKTAGIYISSEAELKKYYNLGVRYFLYKSDVMLLIDGIRPMKDLRII